ncbi:MAG: hypothetical protein R3300_18625 [Candidatus Promineifilaceae bacterium]|nr:hypothetical protein [Candidatus Promineifilaceae bacterium]
MTEQITFFISAAADLQAEREVLGRSVAEIPVDLSWRLVQSELHSEPVDLEAVRQADVHVLLLGGDIRAPVGHEWLVARRSDRQPRLFLKQAQNRTPAAVDFVRYVARHDSRQFFRDPSHLRLQVLRVLGDYLWRQRDSLGLTVAEIERLRAWRAELAGSGEVVDQETRGGAGASSLLFSRARPSVSEGVPVVEKQENDAR